MVSVSKFVVSMVLLVGFDLSLSAATCEWEYQGVVGQGAEAVGVVKELKTMKSFFLKVGSYQKECSADVIEIGRNKIVIVQDGKSKVLTPGGFHERKVADASTELSKDLQERLVSAEGDVDAAIEALSRAGAEAVEKGLISQEEVNKALADESNALQELLQ